jgi:hypothetical protein
MKNTNLLLLLGAGVAYYFFYKMNANKNTSSVIKTPGFTPPLYDISRPDPFYDNISVTNVPNQFLVDKVRTPELDYTPDTYQTFYGSVAGTHYKVPTTC